MGATHNPNLKSGIKLNGNDMFDYDTNDIKQTINSLPENQRELVNVIIKSMLLDSDDDDAIAIPDDYAKHAGRPSLKELPYMSSENDGHSYIPGHSPACDGNKEYPNPNYPVYRQEGAQQVCWCEWIGYKKF